MSRRLTSNNPQESTRFGFCSQDREFTKISEKGMRQEFHNAHNPHLADLFTDRLEAIMGPTLTYITEEEINTRIKAILGLLDRDVTPYDGGDLPSADAARKIDAVVKMYTARGDAAELPDALTLFDDPCG